MPGVGTRALQPKEGVASQLFCLLTLRPCVWPCMCHVTSSSVPAPSSLRLSSGNLREGALLGAGTVRRGAPLGETAKRQLFGGTEIAKALVTTTGM